MSPDPAILVSDLSVEYPARGASPSCVALRGVSFRLEAGQSIGVLGETGSGKSTLASVLAGRGLPLRSGEPGPRISGGDATVLGHSLRHARKRDLAEVTFHVGYLPQEGAATLEPTLSVQDNVSLPIFERDHHYNRRAAGERAALMLDTVHLPLSVLAKYPYELSAGQRQRVALAKALVLGPQVLVVDEPTAGIDATVRDAVIDLLARLREHAGFTAVIVSHDLAVLRRATDVSIVLQGGRPVGYGPIEEVLAEPSHPFVRGLAEALKPPQRRTERRPQRAN
ncbi:ATP-binding cassette domain-containing protein [Leifsonia sp. TF02-11]|uniref:ATP-binding cassette domain-containing protein n=1 Tax=Leifsonia sp. TF02-11 TaxID=2815212 RepID=UPI001AA11705|nr:ATP-binding cassette domain-containing protein [Leifsonia sp. TF02-11]MBN9630203.1 ATP-binding cassette domain-containing protein [Actinomycetota bacterium]MBO1738277.1 ATP-binding cassette domain-containing protein [Leifsonia sp. TF02-11]